jgi:hypothetical protein
MHSQDKSAQGTVQVHLVATNEAQHGDEVPTLQRGDVKVKQGKNFLKVNQLIPAKGENAALQLFVLIDDTLDTGIGNNLNDIRDFVNAQPASTVIAVGYMSNAPSKSPRTSPPITPSPSRRSACRVGACRQL